MSSPIKAKTLEDAIAEWNNTHQKQDQIVPGSDKVEQLGKSILVHYTQAKGFWLTETSFFTPLESFVDKIFDGRASSSLPEEHLKNLQKVQQIYRDANTTLTDKKPEDQHKIKVAQIFVKYGGECSIAYNLLMASPSPTKPMIESIISQLEQAQVKLNARLNKTELADFAAKVEQELKAFHEQLPNRVKNVEKLFDKQCCAVYEKLMDDSKTEKPVFTFTELESTLKTLKEKSKHVHTDSLQAIHFSDFIAKVEATLKSKQEHLAASIEKIKNAHGEKCAAVFAVIMDDRKNSDPVNQNIVRLENALKQIQRSNVPKQPDHKDFELLLTEKIQSAKIKKVEDTFGSECANFYKKFLLQDETGWESDIYIVNDKLQAAAASLEEDISILTDAEKEALNIKKFQSKVTEVLKKQQSQLTEAIKKMKDLFGEECSNAFELLQLNFKSSLFMTPSQIIQMKSYSRLLKDIPRLERIAHAIKNHEIFKDEKFKNFHIIIQYYLGKHYGDKSHGNVVNIRDNIEHYVGSMDSFRDTFIAYQTFKNHFGMVLDFAPLDYRIDVLEGNQYDIVYGALLKDLKSLQTKYTTGSEERIKLDKAIRDVEFFCELSKDNWSSTAFNTKWKYGDVIKERHWKVREKIWEMAKNYSADKPEAHSLIIPFGYTIHATVCKISLLPNGKFEVRVINTTPLVNPIVKESKQKEKVADIVYTDLTLEDLSSSNLQQMMNTVDVSSSMDQTYNIMDAALLQRTGKKVTGQARYMQLKGTCLNRSALVWLREALGNKLFREAHAQMTETSLAEVRATAAKMSMTTKRLIFSAKPAEGQTEEQYADEMVQEFIKQSEAVLVMRKHKFEKLTKTEAPSS